MEMQVPARESFNAFEKKELISILHVEDDQCDALLFASLLSQCMPGQYTLTHAGDLNSASTLLADKSFHIVILDTNLPDSFGARSVDLIQQCNGDIPIVCISGVADNDIALEMVSAGAQDFLSKSDMSPGQVARALRFAVCRKQTEKRLQAIAQCDALTGLPNRALFEDRLTHAIARALRYKTSVALMFLDVDHFKTINDTLGHAAGDAVLQCISQRLSDCVRESDTIARLGGDEFTILLEGATCEADVTIVADKILETIKQPLILKDRFITPSLSIGIALFSDDCDGQGELIARADIAMYKTKAAGRNGYAFYTPDMMEKAVPMQGCQRH